MPSSSIPLNGLTWTSIGPSPIAVGQSPGSPTSTGRVNDIAVDPSDPNVMYAAADTGGIWKTTDGAKTWAPRTDQSELLISQLEMVNRGVNDTVYAFTQDGRLLKSVDGATTFTATAPLPIGSVVNKLVVTATNATDSTKDILFAATGGVFGGNGSGIWRSVDGGTTWALITDLAGSPFFSQPGFLPFTDVAIDPTNPNVVYGAIGYIVGDARNGVYRTSTALSATPQWTLLIGGSAFFPGSTPGPIKIAVSPVLPSTIFAAATLRADPRTGAVPVLGIFRTNDSGVNWAPVLITNPTNQTADPRNYMGISGEDNNMILVSPFSPPDPSRQIVYVGGYGLSNNVLLSTDSGNSFPNSSSDAGIGANGVGANPNVHEGVIDSQGRLVIATGGGVYRLDSTNPLTWVSLNGNIGPTGLGVVQFNGFALHPTNPDQAIGNAVNQPSVAGGGVRMHNALLFSDTFGASNAAYGWTTVDANGIDGNSGSGQVIYNPFNPSIVYRVTDGSGGTAAVRQSLDGGLTWQPAVSGYQGYPFGGGFYVPPLVMDPSRPNRLYSGYTHVVVTDDNANSWQEAVRVSTTGASVAIPSMPTYVVTRQGGGPIGLDAISVGRESGVGGDFFFSGAALFVATELDAARDPMSGDPMDAAVGGPTLYMTVIPDTTPWPPSGLTWSDRAWVRVTPDANGDGLSDLRGQVQQILVDPANNNKIYVVDSTGQVFRGTIQDFAFLVDAQKRIVGNTTITWQNLTGNLPPASPLINFSFGLARVTPLALDTRIATDATDDFLYAATGQGVWRLLNPEADFSQTPAVWQEVGTSTGPGGQITRSMPVVPVTALSLNTTTGILGAATYGRGVYELQIRGLVRGQVFNDINGNGIRDPGETGIAAVVVRVLDATQNPAPVIASTVTDANGVYEFRSLRDGTYRIDISGPGGVFQTTAQQNNLVITEQSTFSNVNFGYFTAGAVSGFVYQDANSNGTMDAGEPGLAGFTVFIDRNNNGTLDTGEPSVVSAANGSYIFTGLGPDVILGNPNDPASGPFAIRVVPRTGFTATVPAAGVAQTVSLNSAQTVTGVNFGFRSGGGGQTLPGGQQHDIVTALDTDGAPVVTLRNQTTGQTRTINAYALGFRGGVRVATADFNGDGTPDVVTGPGPGGGPHVRVFDGASGALLKEFMAYDTAFRGGIFVAAGDVNGDGTPDIITGAGASGGPHVKVFSGTDLSVIYSFFAYDPTFFGGVTVAAGDLNGDNRADIITGAGPGGGPHVKAFSGADQSVLSSFFAYNAAFRGGVFVAAGDINGDTRVDIITGPGSGGGSDVRAFDPATGRQFLGFQAFPNSGFITAQSSGARVATTDFDVDGVSDFVVSSGRGRGPQVRVFSGRTLSLLTELTVADPSFLGGVFVGGF